MIVWFKVCVCLSVFSCWFMPSFVCLLWCSLACLIACACVCVCLFVCLLVGWLCFDAVDCTLVCVCVCLFVCLCACSFVLV